MDYGKFHILYVMVPTQAGNIPMKHTDPNFWKYVVAYVLLGAGSILLIGEIVEC